MNNFDYVRPASVAEAVAAAAQPGSSYLGAGTNLLDLMKGNIVRPERLVDITRLPGLDRLDWLDDGGVRIGALVRNSDLAYDQRFATAYPAIAEALLSGASAQLRNAATAGGNIMQRTRCQYFYDAASRCNKRDPGAGCDAQGGLTRLHAVLGWSEQCIATHPSDFCVPLAAYDAVVEIEGRRGRREVPLEALHLLPGDTPERETALEAGELVVALRLPSGAAFRNHSRYLKIRERTSYAFAVVSAAAAVHVQDKVIVDARLALGGVALKPWRTRAAEAALRGKSVDDVEARRTAADAAVADAKPAGDNAFKIELARRIIGRALAQALAGTPNPLPALPASPMAQATSATSSLGVHQHA